jgi:YD repeat-containing protein
MGGPPAHEHWLDRLIGKSYSNKDPSVTYYYDQASYNGLTITNGKGQRTGMSDGSGQTAWSYDTMGRTVAEQRTIASVTKTMSFSRCAEPPEYGHEPSHQRQLLLGPELRLRSLRKPFSD